MSALGVVDQKGTTLANKVNKRAQTPLVALSRRQAASQQPLGCQTKPADREGESG